MVFAQTGDAGGGDLDPLPAGLRRRLEELFPGARVTGVTPLRPDGEAAAGPTAKAVGYGAPLRIQLHHRGDPVTVVFRTATANRYGHDRRADRAASMLLAYDTFESIPGHVAPLDVGAIGGTGRLISLADAGELYLVTSYARGDLYADDLRRVARRAATDGLDVSRCDGLAGWLADLHRVRPPDGGVYRRAVRDLLGSGEGIFGVVDGYPEAGAPGAPADRLRALERRCLEWRWTLRDREGRLRRIHGDFHPFNVVFQGQRVVTLDASRGCAGDPADDVTAMTINYLFFAAERPGAWAGAFRLLYRRFFEAYLAATGDRALLEVAPPYLAWRTLVVCSPDFYPELSGPARDRLLAHAERALDRGAMDLDDADEVFG
jgi:hypothetical protein